jgi:hypothetical protein
VRTVEDQFRVLIPWQTPSYRSHIRPNWSDMNWKSVHARMDGYELGS